MPLLSSATNSILNNTQLTDITVNNSPLPTGMFKSIQQVVVAELIGFRDTPCIDILFEASIPDVAHDSSARDPPPRCFPSTREQYIKDITTWALPAVSDTPLPIYWMKDPAGVGKSAVAQTAETLKKQKRLGAAFFFSINRWSKPDTALIKSKKEHHKFFTSIAFQLSNICPDYNNLPDTKIRRNRSLVDKSMMSQSRELIVEPLRELEEQGKGIGKRIPVLIDGLDECESRVIQCRNTEITLPFPLSLKPSYCSITCLLTPTVFLIGASRLSNAD